MMDREMPILKLPNAARLRFDLRVHEMEVTLLGPSFQTINYDRAGRTLTITGTPE
jgi:hypothetical protein